MADAYARVSGGIGVVENGTATLGGDTSSSNGGPVTVTTTGTITTEGNNSIGIIAQSVGGGGGVALSTGAAVTGTFKAGTGNGDAVTVNV